MAEQQIIEPESASWVIEPTTWRWLYIDANTSDRNLFIRRTYPDSSTKQERIEVHLSDVEPLIGALRNAQEWLNRAIAQRIDLEEVPF